MNILIPTADYPPIEGGIATVTVETARALAAMGHSVTVVAPWFSHMKDFDAEEPVTVVRYRGYGLGWFRIAPMIIATAPRLAKADLIFGINVSYGGVIGWLSRKPYVTFAYAYEFLKFQKRPLPRALLLRVYGGSRATVAISEFTRGRLREFGLDDRQIETVSPGASLNHAPGEARIAGIKRKYVIDTDHLILAVGRLIPRKGHLALVEAFPAVLEKYPDAVLMLVGRGPMLPDVSRRAEELGVRPQVRLPGRLSEEEVAALYGACEIFALPTGEDDSGQVEGFGLVFSEAHAQGKPVVAGRSGGVTDAVLDGETGILVEPGDVRAIADALLELLDDPGKARALGRRGRERIVSELNWNRFAERVLAAVEARK